MFPVSPLLELGPGFSLIRVRFLSGVGILVLSVVRLLSVGLVFFRSVGTSGVGCDGSLSRTLSVIKRSVVIV